MREMFKKKTKKACWY